MSRKLILAVVVLLLSCLGVEGYFRTQPLLRAQAVRKLENHTLRILNGVPVWATKNPQRADVNNKRCLDTAPDGPDVYLLGDSIFFGVRLSPEKTLGPLLQDMLSTELGRSACVVNLSEPGFGFVNEKAVLEEAMTQHKPKVVVLQIWFNSISKFVVLGGNAYNFGRLLTDSYGIPNLGIPVDLNRVLFQSSATWRNISTGFASTQDAARISTIGKWKMFTENELEPFRQWLDDQGIQLMLAYATSFKTPFSEGRRVEDEVYAATKSWAAEHKLVEVSLAEVLGQEKTDVVGIDSCCHLSEYGTQLVADAIAPELVRLLDSKAD